MLKNLYHSINYLSVILSTNKPKIFLAMQNPFGLPTYKVGKQIYRRNCPLEMMNTSNPAAAAKQNYNELEEEEETTCELIEEIKEEFKEEFEQGFI